ncbi:DNA polymerase III subunit gamma/tau [Leptolyngbya sp. NIES-3755]|nr:DNA polymerase III subunit gamma/tau [Leptolyngbya sp. NIES-3755]
MLTSASFNALLKTLEEPPEQVVFVLATTDPQRVLPTIISRCQRFDFRRIPIDDMTQHLKMIAEKEQIPIADDALYLIAQISQGGLRDAESLLDQLSLLSGDITTERVWDLVGAVPERDLMALIEAIAQNHPESVLDTTRRLMDRGREPLIVLQNLASFYRDLLIAKTAPDRGDLVALTSPTWTQLCEFAKGMSIETILSGQQRLKESEIQLKNSTQPRLWLEVTLMGLLTSAPPVEQPTRSVSPVIEQPPRSISRPVSKPVEAVTQTESVSSPIEEPKPVEEPIEESIQTEETDLDRLWQTIINNIQPFGTQALFKQHGNLVSCDGEAAQISFPQKLLPMAQSRSKSIVAALSKTFGKEIKFSLVAASVTGTNEERSTNLPTPTAEPSDPDPEPIRDRTPDPEPFPEEPTPEAYKRPDWDEDEVTRAARTLAEAFNGSLVDDEADIDTIEVSDLSSDIAPLEDTIEEDEEDDTDF